MGEAKRRKQLDPNFGKSNQKKSQVSVKIQQSEISGRWLCLLTIEGFCQDRSMRVWSTKERAETIGKKELLAIYSQYTVDELKQPDKWKEAQNKLTADDDEIVAVLVPQLDGTYKVETDPNFLKQAMRSVDNHFVNNNQAPLFGV